MIVVIHSVQADNQFEGWASWLDAKESWDMINRRNDAGELSMVNDELGGVWSKSVI